MTTHSIDEAALASTDEMMAWVRQVVSFGVRRPGHAPDDQCESWCASMFEQLGLADVRLEPVDVSAWESDAASLAVHHGGATTQIPAFALPYTASQAVDAPLVRVGEGDLAGAIAVEEIMPTQLLYSALPGMATAVYDPEGEFDHLVHTVPFNSRGGDPIPHVIEAGAVGYIGVLTGFPWDTHDYYVPYDAVPRPLPAVWVSRSHTDALRAFVGDGARAQVEVKGTIRATRSHNVLGVLEGASDEWVVIGSHHDAPWASAVEDASGIALVLAQAAYWARVPREARPHNMLFVLHAGHMAGGVGCEAMLVEHRDLLDKTVLAIHLEHAAAECTGEDGALVPTGDPEVRWWFTSKDPRLEATVLDALAAEDLRRSLILPPQVFSAFPPTDGGMFHTVGVPLVNFLSAPVYLFDPCDTVDKVHQPSLPAITRAAVRILAATAGRTAADARAAIQGHAAAR